MMSSKEFAQHLRNDGHVVVSENRRVQVKEILTHDEKAQIAQEMAQQIKEAEEKEEDIKTVTGQMKAELKTIQGAASLNASLLTTGYRILAKPAAVVADFERRTRVFIDIETGAEIGTEPLQEGDYQIAAAVD